MRKRRRVMLIGSDTHYGRPVIRGIYSFCRVHRPWELQLGRDNSPEALARAKAAIEEWGAEGIIASVLSNRVERFVREAGVPAVIVTGARELDLPTVVADQEAVGRMVARYLLDRGFRHFAFSARTPEWSSALRCRGFEGELKRAGFSCDVWTDLYSGRSEPHWWRNRERMNRWLLGLKKPVGLMCVYDIRGQEVAEACGRLGLKSPEEVAIVSVGNDEMICLTSEPRLSSVDTDVQRIGFEAARLLDRMMRGGRAPKKPLLVPPVRVVTRQSSDIVAIEDRDIAGAVQFIREHADRPFNVKELLQQVPVSRRHLEQQFRKLLGRTPAEEILRVRLERARSLLGETDLPIPEVARASGFTGREIFAVCFRRKVGMTPGKWRRRSRLTSGGAT